jgi:hypothetical protein
MQCALAVVWKHMVATTSLTPHQSMRNLQSATAVKPLSKVIKDIKDIPALALYYFYWVW